MATSRRPLTPSRTTTKLLFISILTLNSLLRSSARPLFFIYNSKPKCMGLEAPEGTLLAIHYEAPDINPIHKHLKPATIVINPPSPFQTVRDYLNPTTPTDKKKTKTDHPTITKLTSHSGKILHHVKRDGKLSICVRSPTAEHTNPQRFSIHVTSGQDKSHYQQEEMEHHLTKLSSHVMMINDEMQAVIAEADMAKEREMVYHEQSESMHSGAMYWPVLHVCVLILVGVTQAGHMIRFFKSKNLV